MVIESFEVRRREKNIIMVVVLEKGSDNGVCVMGEA